MATRLAWIAVLVFVASILSGCPKASGPAKADADTAPPPTAQTANRPTGVVGYYALDDPAVYGVESMKEVPPGQVRHLGLEKGRWVLRDMMVGFGGTWVETAEGGDLTVTMGPSGPAKDRDLLKAVRTSTGLLLRDPAKRMPEMKFTFLAVSAPEGFAYDEILNTKK